MTLPLSKCMYNTSLLFCLKPGKDSHGPSLWDSTWEPELGVHLQQMGLSESVPSVCVCDSGQDRGWECAFPQVSATFAASLVSSPAIGAYLSASYGDSLVVLVATVVAVLDICFILLAVPESLPEKMRPLSWGAKISWKQADPFAVIKTWKYWIFLQLSASHQLLIPFFLQEK